MSNEILKRDDNRVPVLGAITNDVNQEVRMLRVDPVTGRLIVSAVVAGTNNGQLKVSNDDTTYGYLENKLVGGSGVTLTVLNDGGNESLQIDIAGLSGTPTEVLYFDSLGVPTSDSLFTRNPTTKATFIGLTGTNLASNFQITPTGNSLIWNADTTDNVQDIIAQSQSIGGSPFKGNGVSHLNTVTGENAYMVIGDATGIGQRPFTAILAYTSSGNTLNHEFKADDTGAAMSHRDSVADTRGYMTTFTGGNLIVWDADTTDTITTKIEQNQSILGLGGFSGTALIWQDTSTQVHGIVGAVDGTAAGLFPGSTIMATNNIATGASSSILTNYDNVLNVATAVANVSNGNFDSGFEFDDDRTVVRYRNTTTGLESSFETDATSAVTRYTADGTTEYLTQLSDGVFQFFNNTTSDQYMVLGASTGIYQFGDISGALNSTVLVVNDTSRFIDLNVESALGYSFNVTASGTSNYAQLFGSDNSDYTGIIRAGFANTVMESQNSLLSTSNLVQTSSAAVTLSSSNATSTSQLTLASNITSLTDLGGNQLLTADTDTANITIGDIDAISKEVWINLDNDNALVKTATSGIIKQVIGANKTLTDNTSTDLFEISLPVGGMTGGFFTITITATDGTELQTRSEHVTYAAVNKGGVYSSQIIGANDAQAHSAGTLSTSWAITGGTNKVTISVTANSSLTVTVMEAYYQLDNNNGHQVTIL